MVRWILPPPHFRGDILFVEFAALAKTRLVIVSVVIIVVEEEAVKAITY